MNLDYHDVIEACSYAALATIFALMAFLLFA